MPGFPKSMTTKLRIGTDIASIHRQRELLERLITRSGPALTHGFVYTGNQTPLARFLVKTFHRWEFPHLEWMFVRLANQWRKANGPSDEYHRLLERWATWQAGRWAMKEAAVKALSPRPIYPRQVAILSRDIYEMLCTTPLVDLQSHSTPIRTVSFKSRQGKPLVLIEPPARKIAMSPKVARARGIAAGPERVGTIYRKEFKDLSQWTLVDGSVSHDAGVAVASVLAEFEDIEDHQGLITDDGSSKIPIHEPQLGDQGFFAWKMNTAEDDID